MEQWRSVIGFEGRYEVSDQGRVRRLACTIVRKDGTTYPVCEQLLSLVSYGHKRLYKGVGFKLSGRRTRVFGVHRLVAEAFLSNPQDLREVNHKILDKHDNRAENLEWCSSTANHVHAAKRGRYHGHTNANMRRKLEPEQVHAILARLAEGAKGVDLAEDFGVSPSMICAIRKGRAWAQPAEVYAHVA